MSKETAKNWTKCDESHQFLLGILDFKRSIYEQMKGDIIATYV